MTKVVTVIIFIVIVIIISGRYTISPLETGDV
jgi:hypothetical protein